MGGDDPGGLLGPLQGAGVDLPGRGRREPLAEGVGLAHPLLTEAEPLEVPVEDPRGVLHVAVPDQMDAGGGHAPIFSRPPGGAASGPRG